MSLIISSPLDKSENDIGIYSLFAVDNDGKAVRLTYTIQEGNGINDTGIQSRWIICTKRLAQDALWAYWRA